VPEKLDPEAKRLRKVSPAYLADQIGALEARIEVFKAEAIRRELRRAEGEAYRIVLTPPGTSQRTDKPLLLKVLGITGIVAWHARLKAAQKRSPDHRAFVAHAGRKAGVHHRRQSDGDRRLRLGPRGELPNYFTL
jgi:hypothetical protein